MTKIINLKTTKAGPILCSIGGLILLFSTLLDINYFIFYQDTDVFRYIYNLFMAFSGGVILLGAIIGIKGKRIGTVICLIMGIVTVLGMVTYFGQFFCTLSEDLRYIAVFPITLVLIGSIINIVPLSINIRIITRIIFALFLFVVISSVFYGSYVPFLDLINTPLEIRIPILVCSLILLSWLILDWLMRYKIFQRLGKTILIAIVILILYLCLGIYISNIPRTPSIDTIWYTNQWMLIPGIILVICVALAKNEHVFNIYLHGHNIIKQFQAKFYNKHMPLLLISTIAILTFKPWALRGYPPYEIWIISIVVGIIMAITLKKSFKIYGKSSFRSFLIITIIFILPFVAIVMLLNYSTTILIITLFFGLPLGFMLIKILKIIKRTRRNAENRSDFWHDANHLIKALIILALIWLVIAPLIIWLFNTQFLTWFPNLGFGPNSEWGGLAIIACWIFSELLFILLSLITLLKKLKAPPTLWEIQKLLDLNHIDPVIDIKRKIIDIPTSMRIKKLEIDPMTTIKMHQYSLRTFMIFIIILIFFSILIWESIFYREPLLTVGSLLIIFVFGIMIADWGFQTSMIATPLANKVLPAMFLFMKEYLSGAPEIMIYNDKKWIRPNKVNAPPLTILITTYPYLQENCKCGAQGYSTINVENGKCINFGEIRIEGDPRLLSINALVHWLSLVKWNLSNVRIVVLDDGQSWHTWEDNNHHKLCVMCGCIIDKNNPINPNNNPEINQRYVCTHCGYHNVPFEFRQWLVTQIKQKIANIFRIPNGIRVITVRESDNNFKPISGQIVEEIIPCNGSTNPALAVNEIIIFNRGPKARKHRKPGALETYIASDFSMDGGIFFLFDGDHYPINPKLYPNQPNNSAEDIIKWGLENMILIRVGWILGGAHTLQYTQNFNFGNDPLFCTHCGHTLLNPDGYCLSCDENVRTVPSGTAKMYSHWFGGLELSLLCESIYNRTMSCGSGFICREGLMKLVKKVFGYAFKGVDPTEDTTFMLRSTAVERAIQATYPSANFKLRMDAWLDYWVLQSKSSPDNPNKAKFLSLPLIQGEAPDDFLKLVGPARWAEGNTINLQKLLNYLMMRFRTTEGIKVKKGGLTTRQKAQRLHNLTFYISLVPLIFVHLLLFMYGAYPGITAYTGLIKSFIFIFVFGSSLIADWLLLSIVNGWIMEEDLGRITPMWLSKAACESLGSLYVEFSERNRYALDFIGWRTTPRVSERYTFLDKLKMTVIWCRWTFIYSFIYVLWLVLGYIGVLTPMLGGKLGTRLIPEPIVLFMGLWFVFLSFHWYVIYLFWTTNIQKKVYRKTNLHRSKNSNKIF